MGTHLRQYTDGSVNMKNINMLEVLLNPWLRLVSRGGMEHKNAMEQSLRHIDMYVLLGGVQLVTLWLLTVVISSWRPLPDKVRSGTKRIPPSLPSLSPSQAARHLQPHTFHVHSEGKLWQITPHSSTAPEAL